MYLMPVNKVSGVRRGEENEGFPLNVREKMKREKDGKWEKEEKREEKGKNEKERENKRR